MCLLVAVRTEERKISAHRLGCPSGTKLRPFPDISGIKQAAASGILSLLFLPVSVLNKNIDYMCF